jgi:signal transduction histidine kinase/arsenate reductase-like glutaredoxin family protein
MKDLNKLQQSLIHIFKVSIQEDSLEELVSTCHIELEKLMGKDKAENFYLAVLNKYKGNLEKKARKKSKQILNKNARLKREIAKVKKSEKIQKVLYNISEAKSNTRNLRDLLSKIHEQVGTLMDTSNFYVAIVEDKEKGLFRLPYIVDENPEEIENPDAIVDLAGGFTDYVLKTQRPLLADQKKVKKLEKSSAVKQVGVLSQSWLGIPLKTPGGEILGVVAVQSYTDPHAYTRIDADILSIISTTIAGAVKDKQSEEERNSLEEKLSESQKMEAVGVLAAGVAHEFNNLLSIIIGHAYNGMRACEEETGNYKRYSKIEKASERAAELIEKLMVFAQKRERGRYFIDDMARAINEAVVKARNAAPAGCHISVNIKGTLWPVKIDREEIDDVLSNILDNALRAVDGSNNGMIKISAENFKGRPAYSPLTEAYKYIYIKIEDNGRGMDEETRTQIFNPFFTTRDPGKGTGMGLAIVYTILKEYYGTIHVESEKGKGTIVHIYLPTISFLS